MTIYCRNLQSHARETYEVKELKQRQRSRSVPLKSCSENVQQSCRGTPMPKCNFTKLLCNFIEIAIRYGYPPANLLPQIFRTLFYKITYGGLPLLKN